MNFLDPAVGRTEDPTDLAALVMLPLAYRYQLSERFAFQLHSIPVALISFFAFCATSRVPGHLVRTEIPGIQYQFNCSKPDLINALNELSLEKLNKQRKFQTLVFDSEGDLFYSLSGGDTLAVMLDYSIINDRDTIRYATYPSEFIVFGTDSHATLVLVSVETFAPFSNNPKPLSDDAIRGFEKNVVDKLKKCEVQ